MLLVGGGGHMRLNDHGCPRRLKGNSLVRMLPLFRAAEFVTALVDAPSDYPGNAGLKRFRTDAAHAADLATVIKDLRARTGGAVWVIGTSRGSISAVNVAARAKGTGAPDGVILTSPLTSGVSSGRKPCAADTVFDLPLEQITAPVLVVGHEADSCARTPPAMMQAITDRTRAARKQVVTVTGGSAAPGVRACAGRTAHGFLGREQAVVDGLSRFIRGGRN